MHDTINQSIKQQMFNFQSTLKFKIIHFLANYKTDLIGNYKLSVMLSLPLSCNDHSAAL